MTTIAESLVTPTAQLIEWAECELGVIIHLDVQVFEPDYEFRKDRGYSPSPQVFNPTQLNTDQWLDAAAKAGAKYAVLVAKHCSGFSLWPTQAHDYSIAASPWRDGKGDIVGDFIASCHRYGVKPGIYCSASANAYLNVDNPGTVLSGDPEEQQRYNEIVLQQLTELWTNYGELFEIWFDGGVLSPEQGGPDIAGLLKQLQPDAVVYCGPPNARHLVRCSGNELGYAVPPNWSTTDASMNSGNPDGALWAPAECDIPNRKAEGAFQGGWFWRKDDEQFLYSAEELLEGYFNSIGRGSNLLMGMVIDDRGLVPDADVQVFAELGERLQGCFGNRVATTQGEGSVFTLDIPSGHAPNILEIKEEISDGERVRQWRVEAFVDAEWVPIWAGSCIGHRRLERFEPIRTNSLRLTILDAVDEPQIREFSAYLAPGELLPGSLNIAERSQLTIARDINGEVSLRCSDPSLSMRYSVDGSEPNSTSQLYTGPFAVPDGTTVRAFSFINDQCRSRSTSVTFGCNRKTWRIVHVSHNSSYVNNGAAGLEKLLDDDPATYWHTYETTSRDGALPQEVVLDAGRTLQIQAFTFLPRTADSREGTPDECEFFLSDDGEVWTLAAQSSFDDLETNTGIRVIPLETVQSGRFIRFVARHAFKDSDYVIVAGIGAVEA